MRALSEVVSHRVRDCSPHYLNPRYFFSVCSGYDTHSLTARGQHDREPSEAWGSEAVLGLLSVSTAVACWRHAIHWVASPSCFGDFAQEVTYHLTIQSLRVSVLLRLLANSVKETENANRSKMHDHEDDTHDHVCNRTASGVWEEHTSERETNETTEFQRRQLQKQVSDDGFYGIGRGIRVRHI
jgi:hypothetical protein